MPRAAASYLRRASHYLLRSVISPFAGGGWRERCKDGLRVGIAMFAATAVTLDMPKGVWAPVTVGFVWEPGLGASLRNSGMRLQGSVLGVFFGYAAYAFGSFAVDAGVAVSTRAVHSFGPEPGSHAPTRPPARSRALERARFS